MDPEDVDILAEQLAYYRARAPEYDEWFLRQGRYDRGDEHRRSWFQEVALLEAALDQAAPAGDVLELACGTGIWTRRLAASARHLTAVDGSPEALALNRARVDAGNVTFVEADLFSWVPAATYDFIFFGFWLSHVPLDRFESFWSLVADCLEPGGRVFFVDDGYRTPDELIEGESSSTIRRRLNDGASYRIVKVPHQPAELEARLCDLGWDIAVHSTAGPFYWGAGTRSS